MKALCNEAPYSYEMNLPSVGLEPIARTLCSDVESANHSATWAQLFKTNNDVVS